MHDCGVCVMSCKTDFKKYFTLTLNLNVINVFRDVCCNQHMKCKHCGKYEHPRSKLMKMFVFRAILQVLSMCV